MLEVDVDGLLAACPDPMLHHHLDLGRVVRGWVGGPATVVQHGVSWPDAPDGALALLCLGPPVALGGLMARVAGVVPAPWRVVAEQAAEDALPPGWRPAAPRRWHWMTTTVAPPPGPEEAAVREVADDEVDAVLDAANPGSFARPGTPGLECWLGVHDRDGRVAALGALLRQPRDGTGHLRGIATLPEHRGRGLGAAVSAALTRRALERGPGLATLGVFTDNEAAVRLYHRLGYAVVHTFVAGTTVPAS